MPSERIEKALEYIEKTTEVRDVLLSGGDALLVSDDRLEYIIKRLRAIDHVEIIRIGSRTPVVMPQRITPELCAMLKKYHPIWARQRIFSWIKSCKLLNIMVPGAEGDKPRQRRSA